MKRFVSFFALCSALLISTAVGGAQNTITGVYNASLVCPNGNITAYSNDKSHFFNTVIIQAPPASLVNTPFTNQYFQQKPGKDHKMFFPNGMNTPGAYVYNIIEQDGSKWIPVATLSCTLSFP